MFLTGQSMSVWCRKFDFSRFQGSRRFYKFLATEWFSDTPKFEKSPETDRRRITIFSAMWSITSRRRIEQAQARTRTREDAHLVTFCSAHKFGIFFNVKHVNCLKKKSKYMIGFRSMKCNRLISEKILTMKYWYVFQISLNIASSRYYNWLVSKVIGAHQCYILT